jgi:aminoglycoside phosphotransferase (APT) family kinase protein
MSQLTPLSPVTAQPGFLTREELVDSYRERTHLDVTALPWYQVLALWKGAIFSEAIHGRWLKGEVPEDNTFASSLKEGVPKLLADARSFVP